MLNTIPLMNKPLCMCSFNNKVYIGDARGYVLMLENEYRNPKVILEADGPVSTIFFNNTDMFYGTWDGILYNKNRKRKLGENPIKCGCYHKDRVFISVDSKLIILDNELTILERIETKAKIFCMDICNNIVFFGMADGTVRRYDDLSDITGDTRHNMSILSLKGELSGSTDSTVKKYDEILYCGSGWIRSIWSENLFSSGKDVVVNKKVAYSHNDEVTGVVAIEGFIISISLDYSYKIYREGFYLSEAEEKELLSML